MEIFDVIAKTNEGQNFEFICRELFMTYVRKRYQYRPNYHIKFFVRKMRNGSIDLDPSFYHEADDSYGISAHCGIFGYKAKIWKDDKGKFWHKGPANLLTTSFDTIEECLNSIYANKIAFSVLNLTRSRKTEALIKSIMEIDDEGKDELNLLLSDYFNANGEIHINTRKILLARDKIEKKIIELTR